MSYILNYILLMLSTIMVIKAYERDGSQRISGRNSKPHILNTDHTRRYNAEVGQKTQIGNSDPTDNSGRHPATGRIPAAVYYNQHPSTPNKENEPKLLAKHEKEPQYDTSASYDESHMLKYKDDNIQGRNHQYNHPDRQTQPAYRDNSPQERYKLQTESQDADVKHYQKSQAHRPREFDSTLFDDSKNVRYESSGEEMRQTDYNGPKEKNTMPVRYSHSVSDYPREIHQKENYQQNRQPYSSESSYKPLDNHHKQHHNQMPHHKFPEASSKEPLSYHQYNSDRGSAPNSEYKDSRHPNEPQTTSDYRDSSHSKQYHTTSGHRDSDPSKQSHTNSDYRESSHAKQFHSNSDYRNSRLPNNPRSNHDYVHSDHPENTQTNPNVRDPNSSEQSQGGYDYKGSSPSGISHSNSNYRNSNLPQDYQSDRVRSHAQNPEGYHDHRNLPPREQTQTQSVRHEAKNSRKQPAPLLNGGNQMRVVSTKKDMQPAPSESDNSFSEEHDGFLDMGAYTDKQGSFGWYADFPVGKEHDKVTYSFS